LSVLSVTLGLMGGRRARERHLRGSRAVPIAGGEGLVCGCTHFARLACLVTCPACGTDTEGLLVMPSTADVGQSRPVIASCACGAEAKGQGVVVEVLGGRTSGFPDS
jgi:hypothetical protein